MGEKRGQRVYIKVPVRGQKNKLVEMAEKNARLVLDQDKERIKKEQGRTIGAVKEISKLLGLPHIDRMEAYDISNINGYQTVGSMIVFVQGRPLKSDYRKFKLKTVTGPDDYGSMREVLTRRFTHGMEEMEQLDAKGLDASTGSFTIFPDVIAGIGT